ncbi:F0F1-type ATP synthase, epsilon subunit (mitochondrial delta subunit) [Hahella chejuensis KCTC 2396]|uniref:F0F1-type ATP synthase, epsilon subunit (Mitochondrial delta subunit) n=1 Tax=Hahella chejuensis (strain KCTC 2396) TaxID=349521 RepID=Q2SNG2_HAHCH|nr:hypothetical protein [Hahella chejuensis]ABC27812.1 F0F1-type ATP synthase, epsilon subunit (mitochondrial delta subunit) [Hahella chejuensis KCTC 2396]
MTPFPVILRDSDQELRIDDVISFRSRDASGGFSLQARHADFLTLTEPGLSRLTQNAGQLFLAATGGLLEFEKGVLYFNTRRFFIDADADLIQTQLIAWLANEKERRSSSHVHLQQLEHELMRRLSRA